MKYNVNMKLRWSELVEADSAEEANYLARSAAQDIMPDFDQDQDSYHLSEVEVNSFSVVDVGEYIPQAKPMTKKEIEDSEILEKAKVANAELNAIGKQADKCLELTTNLLKPFVGRFFLLRGSSAIYQVSSIEYGVMFYHLANQTDEGKKFETFLTYDDIFSKVVFLSQNRKKISENS